MRPRSAASPNVDVPIDPHSISDLCTDGRAGKAIPGSCRDLMLLLSTRHTTRSVDDFYETLEEGFGTIVAARLHQTSPATQARSRTVDCGSTLLLVLPSVMRRMCHGWRRAVRETTCNACAGAESVSQAFSVRGRRETVVLWSPAGQMPCERACLFFFIHNPCRPISQGDLNLAER